MTQHVSIELKLGKRISYKDKPYRIVQILSLDEVELVDELTHESLRAKISELSSDSAPEVKRADLNHIDERAWDTAKYRLSIIDPLIDKKGRTREQVASLAKNNSVHTNTLYSWIRAYEQTGKLSSLLPKSRIDKGASKINSEVEEIIKEVIAVEYLTKQKKSQKKVCDEVRRKCLENNIETPHDNTVRNRIKTLSGELVASKRLGRKTADLSFRPHEGKFPGADWPLAVVQVDHTKLDIILVDDHYRHPIGRPWITLAFDVFSRMVTGFYISFDPPNALSTGLCLAHSILPKEQWLAKFEVNSDWPIWGLPTTIHVDNAKEFRGNMIQKACDEYGVNLEWRPVGRPNFGAHVERVLGTFSKEIHTLPGTTFANIVEKGEYKSDKHATLTLSEFEEWLTIYIVDIYHNKVHSSIQTTPLAMYKKGILGTPSEPGVGLPAKIADEERLKLDFMPFEMRTIQDYGVVVDEVHYYHDVLRHWINAVDLDEPKKKRKFIFRRDPRDISQIWFYDPDLNCYFAIPYRDTSHPAISVWEFREAKKLVKNEGIKHVDENAIFDAYERMRELEQKSIDKSKSAKRAKQRRKDHKLAIKPKLEKKVTPEIEAFDDIEIEPFDEMDELP